MSNSINKQVANVLWRVAFFIVYYIFLICCGIGLIGITLYITVYALFDVLPSLDSINIRVLIIAVLSLLVMWGVVGLFAVYLIKPLFAFNENESPNRVEIKECDAPLLFKCIRELAATTGCKMPKHVFLTTDVNACVFYDTSFWSIFFPIRKNLEIGLGLFQSTNVDELRAIIGHEFGHFSQSSMKVGSTVYVVNSVLYNLVYEKDFFEEWIDDLCKSETSAWIRVWGGLTRWLTNLVRRMNIQVYKIVQKAYMALSRQMEYDADNVSCNVVGKETFISALCKIEILAQFQNIYEQFLQHLNAQEKVVADYWNGYEKVKELIAKDYSYTFDYMTRFAAPIIESKHPSRISADNVWSSHPSLRKRIENAQKSQTHSSSAFQVAWALIPSELKEKISTYRLNQFSQNGTKQDVISDEDFKAWVKNEIDTYFIPLNLKPFFGRDIPCFKYPSDEEIASHVDNPLTDENASLLDEYEVGLQDWNLLNAIVSKQVETKSFIYCGKEHKRKNAPIEQHRSYMAQLFEKVQRIDRNVCIYIAQRSDKPERIRYSYFCIFQSSYILPILNRFAARRNEIIGKWNSYGGHDDNDFSSLCSNVNEMTQAFQKLIGENVDWGLLQTVVDAEEFEKMHSFLNAAPLNSACHPNSVNYYLGMVLKFGNAYQYMANLGKHILVQDAKRVM